MNVVWIVVGVAIFAVLVRQFAWWPRRESRSNLGSVSERWVDEHRLD